MIGKPKNPEESILQQKGVQGVEAEQDASTIQQTASPSVEADGNAFTPDVKPSGSVLGGKIFMLLALCVIVVAVVLFLTISSQRQDVLPAQVSSNRIPITSSTAALPVNLDCSTTYCINRSVLAPGFNPESCESAGNLSDLCFYLYSVNILGGGEAADKYCQRIVNRLLAQDCRFPDRSPPETANKGSSGVGLNSGNTRVWRPGYTPTDDVLVRDAVISNNGSICDGVANENARGMCARDLLASRRAAQAGNASLCENISTFTSRSACFASVQSSRMDWDALYAAIKTSDASGCSKIRFEDMRSLCGKVAASSDAGLCDLFGISDGRDSCYFSMYLRSGNRSLCGKISQNMTRSICESFKGVKP
jgi:hypothetical protein